MKASVIIPTRGRDQCVRQTLEDLALQSYKNFDVWLVDQNKPALKELHKHIGDVTLHHEKMEPLGSHAGRNVAIQKTDSEICIFVDDDVRIDRDFVLKHIQMHQSTSQGSAKIAVYAGKVIQPKDGLSEFEMKSKGHPAKYNKWIGLVSGNFIGEEKAQVDHIHECNFSAKTDVLRRVGGFNTEFKGNAYFEGVDLALKIKQLGFGILYCPEVSLVHLQDGVGGNRVNQKALHTYWYMRNYGLLNSLHMRRLGLPIFASYGITYVIAKAIKNKDVGLLSQGISGFIDGVMYFFKKSST